MTSMSQLGDPTGYPARPRRTPLRTPKITVESRPGWPAGHVHVVNDIFDTLIESMIVDDIQSATRSEKADTFGAKAAVGQMSGCHIA
jgi:hypothetical protein